MTVPEKILLAAISLTAASFSAEDLVVRCWEMYPDNFGLQGYSNKYPDSNRVLTKIMGVSSPLRANGWLTKVAAKKYRVTDAGRRYAASLAEHTETRTRHRLAEVSRASAVTLRRLLGSRAYQKHILNENAFTFGDACELWNISPRSTASQLAARFAEVSSAIDAAMNSSETDHLEIPGGQPATRSDLVALGDLSHELEERFREELDVIRARTHERRR